MAVFEFSASINGDKKRKKGAGNGLCRQTIVFQKSFHIENTRDQVEGCSSYFRLGNFFKKTDIKRYISG